MGSSFGDLGGQAPLSLPQLAQQYGWDHSRYDEAGLWCEHTRHHSSTYVIYLAFPVPWEEVTPLLVEHETRTPPPFQSLMSKLSSGFHALLPVHLHPGEQICHTLRIL